MAPNSTVFTVVLIKPTHYDDDGYPIQWLRTTMPSNTLAAINGLLLDCEKRKVLGPKVEIRAVPFILAGDREMPPEHLDAGLVKAYPERVRGEPFAFASVEIVTVGPEALTRILVEDASPTGSRVLLQSLAAVGFLKVKKSKYLNQSLRYLAEYVASLPEESPRRWMAI